jgi:hypothetical protein
LNAGVCAATMLLQPANTAVASAQRRARIRLASITIPPLSAKCPLRPIQVNTLPWKIQIYRISQVP